MKLCVIESPYRGDDEEEFAYARYLEDCIRDSLERGESPYASHKMLTIALDDDDPKERAQGIAAGLAFAHRADVHAFYVDYSWSAGMLAAKEWCKRNGRPYVIRTLLRS